MRNGKPTAVSNPINHRDEINIPNPSLAPASDEMISRRCRETYLSAKGPFATACERTGSVHVTHDARASAARRLSLGMVARMQPVVKSHMRVIIGSRHM